MNHNTSHSGGSSRGDAGKGPTPLVPTRALRGDDRERRAAAEAWLYQAAQHPQTAAAEWTNQGVALLTAGITWDVVRVPYAVLHPDLDRDTDPVALRRRLNELKVSGSVFCDPYRGAVYFMVPPGTDQLWPRDLAPARVECLGGTRPYIHHVGVPRPDLIAPPGLYWLVPPNSGGRRHVIPEYLYEALRTRVQGDVPGPTSTPQVMA